MGSDRPTLLLVEDDAIIALAETRVLQSAGYDVIGALSGKEALAAVARTNGAIDLILMDVDLGAGVDGTQIAQDILQTHDIPILFLSSHTEQTLVERTEKITSYGYVVKASGDVVLLASIRMAFKLYRAHASLKESVEQFNKLTGTSMDGFLVIDRNTRILEVNEAYCRMTGYSRNELLAMSIAEIDVEDTAAGRQKVLEEIRDAGPEHFEARHRRKDGRSIDVDMSSTFMREQGRYLVFLKDITERKRAEKSLRESEERFHSVWSKSADGMRLTDRNGIVLDVNDAYCRMVKLPREQLLGSVFSIIYTTQGPNDDLTLYQHRFDAGETLSRFAAPAAMWNGDVLHLEISSSFIEQAEHGRMLLSLFRDVTDRMKAEDALFSSEQLHRQLFDEAPLGYHEVDGDGRISRVNRTELRMLGYDARDMLGEPIWKFIVEGEVSEKAVRAKIAGTQEPGAGYERTYKRKDGTTIPALVEDFIIRSSHGEIVGIRSTIQDITARKRFEEALRESEERYRDLVEKMPDGVYRSTHAGRFLEVNQAMVDILGYGSKAELLAIDIKSELYFDEDDRESAALQEKSVEMAVFPLRRKDGTRIWVEDHGRHVMDGSGNVLYHEGILRDVTERKQADEALRLLVRQKETLMQELQHRVKNNLSVISSLLGLELPRIPDAQSREVFIDAQTRIVSMMRIYEQLYSTQSLSHVDLRAYVEELTRGLFKTYALEAERIRLTTDIIRLPLDLSIIVPLGLILNELIANALKYAFAAGVPGELRVALSASDGKLVLHVQDNGVGLPDGIDLEATESMGIRLVMMLTDQLGGTVSFESQSGTHVVVTIPT